MSVTAPQMDIEKFLDLCNGNWFSQRTNYSLGGEKAESGKADLSVTLVAKDDAQLIQVCQEARINPQESIGGLRYGWDTSVDWGKPKQQGSSLMVLVPNQENSTQGKLVSSTAIKPGAKSVGTYALGEDETLTISISVEDIQIEERIWFASENLRLRTATTKQGANISQTTFYSEIRKAAPKKE